MAAKSPPLVIRHHHPEPSEATATALAAAKAEVMRVAQASAITTRHDPEGRARLDALARKGSALAKAQQPKSI